MKKLNSVRKIGALIVIIISVSIIFELPYSRHNFYIPYSEAFKLNNRQFGYLSTIYAIVAAITYLIGGFLADRIKSRWILAVPSFLTAALGFTMSSFPRYQDLVVIYALMGISTVMTLPSTAIRIVRGLGFPDEQSRIFAIYDGSKGIVTALLTAVTLLLFSSLGGGKFGLSWVIRIYSIFNIIAGVLVILMVPDEKSFKKN